MHFSDEGANLKGGNEILIKTFATLLLLYSVHETRIQAECEVASERYARGTN